MTPDTWQNVTDLLQNLMIIFLAICLWGEHRLRRHIPNIHITLEGKLAPNERRPAADE